MLVWCVASVGGLVWAAGVPEASDWTREQGHRWRELTVPAGPGAGFSAVPPAESGLVFTNRLDEWAGAANRVLYNGAGIAAGDYDGDGRPDLFLCDLSGRSALFRNLGGWKFTNVTEEAGLGTAFPGTRGAVFADINGDRHADLLVSVNGRGVVCWINDGKGRFSDGTAQAGTAARTGSTTLALADVEGDGDLDLYVTNYRPDDIRDRGRVNLRMVNGRPVLPGSETNRFVMLDGRLEECGQPDQLYLNDGAGRFRPVSWTDGTFLDEAGKPLSEPPPDWGLTATFRDLNEDGAPDLYVCNDYWSPDRIWLNDGKGRFRALPAGALRKTPASSMGVDFADVDRDGLLDGFAVDMLSRFPAMRKRQGFAQMLKMAPLGGHPGRVQVMRNTLYLNRGDGTYAEVAAFADMTASDWAWSPVFQDVDLDGFPDLLIGAGHFRDVQDYDAEAKVQSLQHPWTGFKTEADRQQAFTRELMEHYHLYPELGLPIGAFRNRGDGTFEEVTAAWGLERPGINQGLALADFDGDGALDLAVNRLNGGALLYRRRTGAARVAVRLRGEPGNYEGVGARVSFSGGTLPRQTAEVIAGGRYQSGSECLLEFAGGGGEAGRTLEVAWRDGRRTVIPGVKLNRLYEIFPPTADSGSPAVPPSRSPEEPVFEDQSAALGHRHEESVFNDLDRQALLPFALSQAGPGVAWFDLDGDGDEDLVFGAGLGARVAAYRNDGQGTWSPWPWAAEASALPDDVLGVSGWVDEAGQRQVLAALTGYESGGAGGVLVVPAAGTGGGRPVPLAAGPPQPGTGVLALGEPMGDGRLHLFAGGGPRGGQYPLANPSVLWRRESGKWMAEPRAGALLGVVGIVNGALWADLDGDGRAELVLACEWGPLRVFTWKGGEMADATSSWGLSAHTGWWRGLAAVDLNNDGRMDLVASNWGRNSPYRATPERPLTWIHGQLAQPGVIDLLEAEWVGGTLFPRRQRNALAQSLPFLQEAFPTHLAYSEANLEQVLGERAVLARRVTVTTLSSMAFLNTGNGFRAVDLPREAQFAPGFGVAVADFDGDGNEDVFMAQNLSAVNPEIGALDAGQGVWLRGDGTGRLAAVPGHRSGIRVTGDQRGAAAADYDGDGRVDLVVTQNAGATRLFRNRGGKPGLRVRLRGPVGNPLGYGAVVRWESGGVARGPARQVHGGGGYGSQDGAVVVMPLPGAGAPFAVVTRWPGGAVTRTPVPEGAREVLVTVDAPPRARD